MPLKKLSKRLKKKMIPSSMYDLLEELPTEEELNEFFGEDAVIYLAGLPSQEGIEAQIILSEAWSNGGTASVVLSGDKLDRKSMKEEITKEVLSYRRNSVWVMRDMVRLMRRAVPHFFAPNVRNSLRFLQEELGELRKEFMISSSGFLRNNKGEGTAKEMGDCIMMLLTYLEQVPPVYSGHEKYSILPIDIDADTEAINSPVIRLDRAMEVAAHIRNFTVLGQNVGDMGMWFTTLKPICDAGGWSPPACLFLSLENIINKHWRRECGEPWQKELVLTRLLNMAKEVEEWFSMDM